MYGTVIAFISLITSGVSTQNVFSVPKPKLLLKQKTRIGIEKMKVRIQIPSYYEKAIEERVSSLEAESRARIHEEVMKERQDIALRSLYLCLLACYEVGW